MSWNNRLYLYAQDHGGTYLGGSPQGWGDEGNEGVLILDYRGLPMVVRCFVRNTRNAYTNSAQVMLSCQLERRFTLSVQPNGGALQKGLNRAKAGLDKGLGMLNKSIDLHQDYGFPEVYASRSIKTDDPEFAKMVLRDLELRNALTASPKQSFRISPSAPDCVEAGQHLILAKIELGSGALGEIEWDIEDLDTSLLPKDQQLAAMKAGNFAEKLEELLRLAKAVHGAVTAWRMPMK